MQTPPHDPGTSKATWARAHGPTGGEGGLQLRACGLHQPACRGLPHLREAVHRGAAWLLVPAHEGSFPKRTSRLSGRYSGEGVGPWSRVSCRAWKARNPAITSSVTGFRYRRVVDKKGMTKDPLHVRQRHPRITCHPVRGRMPQVVQRPMSAQRGVHPAEHRPGRIIGQGPKRATQRSPQRFVPARRN